MATTPGIHKDFNLAQFDHDERAIINTISKEWYVTNSGHALHFTQASTYKFILVKPTDNLQHAFNLERELVCVFSPYDDFHPRILDAIGKAQSHFPHLRVDRICSLVVSKDEASEQKLRQLLQNDTEAQIVVPFTYSELRRPNADTHFFRNRLRAHFYTRDLFASESPLKTDLFFFGRTDLIHQLVDRHRTDQVSALFGLRKAGKTSVIYGVQRALAAHGFYSAFIDCQTPAFHQRRWNQALWYVLNEARAACGSDVRLGLESEFTPERAADLFEKYFLKLHEAVGKKSILLTFDEIENASPGLSPSAHWRDDLDFVLFWQTMRSLFQRKSGLFSYLIVGTNPRCNEQPKIKDVDNPIFAQFPRIYIPRFSSVQTREMVRRLGRLMGLDFDEFVYSQLTEDFGGHPYLIRHLCSAIHRIADSQRPVAVGKALYEKAKKQFIREGRGYFEMILIVLREHYPNEYEMLKFLALGDHKSFDLFATADPAYTEHLQGYGIIELQGDEFVFRVDALKEFLSREARFQRLNLTNQEKWAEISERRNKLEPKLRLLCRNMLQVFYGNADAKQKVLDIFGKARNTTLAGLEYSELFSPEKGQIYWEDLRKMISKHWDCFKHIIGPDQNKALRHLELINEHRADAHAKLIAEDDFQMLRLSFGFFEDKLKQFSE
ncbi:MAG: hypothetical protein FD161_1559 [Limisphaerales bacterium]|nr:MAG: hypothetical protein FD161_1559 [Limisphaerales bacterium]KAG0509373.1 MAG: hypothetical protein E1N63_1478 [Limisphaerales bacterium]TXT52118.1 MAG: hypothetical protein FD140_1051 [Limisphaerales bacterium]